VKGRDIVAYVSDASRTEPVDSRAKQGVRTWTHRVTATGDYRIDVVRQRASGDAVLTYVLSVGLR
jgi:hypothetical protein